MKYTTGTITLGDNEFKATSVDYDSYEATSGTITLGTIEYKSVIVTGIENEDE